MEYTLQHAFDIVIAHARKQQRRAVCGSGQCRYRGVEGRKCFAGVLIKDYEYTPKFEGAVITGLQERLRWSDRLLGMVTRLQQIHDLVKVEFWEEHFADIAEIYELEFTPVLPYCNAGPPDEDGRYECVKTSTDPRRARLFKKGDKLGTYSSPAYNPPAVTKLLDGPLKMAFDMPATTKPPKAIFAEDVTLNADVPSISGLLPNSSLPGQQEVREPVLQGN